MLIRQSPQHPPLASSSRRPLRQVARWLLVVLTVLGVLAPVSFQPAAAEQKRWHHGEKQQLGWLSLTMV